MGQVNMFKIILSRLKELQGGNSVSAFARYLEMWNVVIPAVILVVSAITIITAVIHRGKQPKRLSANLTTISLLQEENARLKRELAETRNALPDIDDENRWLELQRENVRLKRKLAEAGLAD